MFPNLKDQQAKNEEAIKNGMILKGFTKTFVPKHQELYSGRKNFAQNEAKQKTVPLHSEVKRVPQNQDLFQEYLLEKENYYKRSKVQTKPFEFVNNEREERSK